MLCSKPLWIYKSQFGKGKHNKYSKFVSSSYRMYVPLIFIKWILAINIINRTWMLSRYRSTWHSTRKSRLTRWHTPHIPLSDKAISYLWSLTGSYWLKKSLGRGRWERWDSRSNIFLGYFAVLWKIGRRATWSKEREQRSASLKKKMCLWKLIFKSACCSNHVKFFKSF